jgi:hypothetical protein
MVMELFEKRNLKEFMDKLIKSEKRIDEEVFFFLFACFSSHFSFCSNFVCFHQYLRD